MAKIRAISSSVMTPGSLGIAESRLNVEAPNKITNKAGVASGDVSLS